MTDNIPPPAGASNAGAAQGALVLLAEDNEVNRYLAQFLLEHAGYRVAAALNGREAVDLARAERPALILMDIQMPVMDGYEAIALLKADPGLRDVPIVALTAYAMPHDRDRALQVGCVGHIEKPIEAATFIHRITEYMQGSRG